MNKQLNKLYRLSNIIKLISDKIPQLNSYNINRILVWDKSLLNLINDNLNRIANAIEEILRLVKKDQQETKARFEERWDKEDHEKN